MEEHLSKEFVYQKAFLFFPQRQHQQLQQKAREARESSAPPPPPASEPPPLDDPDYEVIEFPGQQYSNAPLPMKANGTSGQC